MSLQAAFEELIELAPEQRPERLRALALSPEERRRLQAMLEDATVRQHPLDVPVAQWVEQWRNDDAAQLSRLVGGRVGPFRVLELIGEGGSAAVFRASRPAGSGEQQVALKVLRAGGFSADDERRFRREQAILAQLTHPNVARLIEGGVDASGHPYIAMELVDGESITRAAAARALGLDARLDWFVSLCRAIDTAHHALIVHCDLKPSNVLVDRSGVLKVLDFGIARLIDAGHDEQPTRTLALTPEYAAPEQFRHGPPRISVDVYALGVLFAELLTGQRLGADSKSLPSAAVAAAGAPDPPAGLPRAARLARALRGDLDAIFAMATRRDPAQRYASAAALADDVERHRAGKPVRARPATWRYRARKFIRRHRLAVGTSAIVVIALVGGLGVASWQAVAARQAAREAQAQAARAGAMRNLVFDVLAEAEPGKPRAAEATVSEAVEHAIDTLLADHGAEPRTRLELLARFADTVGRQGHPDRAQDLLERALAEARETLGTSDPLTWSIEERLAIYETQRGAYDSARRRLDRLLALVPAEVSELRVRVLRASASVAWRQRDTERALRDGRSAVALSRELGDADVERQTLTYFGAALLGVNAVAEAVAVYEKLLALNTARFGPAHEQVALAYAALGRAYRRTGNLPKAEESARKALEIDRAIYPHDHWITANHLNALTMILIQKRDFAGALDASREGLRITSATLDEAHVDRYADAYEVGFVLLLMERYAEAVPYLRDTLAHYARQFGETSHQAVLARAALGYALGMGGDAAQGLAELEGATAALNADPAPDYDLLAKTIERRMRIALERGDAAAAAALIESLAAAVEKIPPGDARPWTGKVDTLRGEILLAQRRPQEAKAALQRAGLALQAGSGDIAVPVEQQLLLAHASAGDSDAAALADKARRALDGLPNAPSRLRRLAAQLSD